MRRSLFILLGLAALSLGVYVTSWAQGGPAPKDLDDLVAQDADFIKTTLAKPNLEKDKKSQRKMRLAALMIAQTAQSGIGMGNPRNGNLATVRDQALALRKAVEDGKFDDAKKLAETLSLVAPVNKAAKIDPAALEKLEDFENVMSQFSSVRLGGFGMEDYLDELTMLKNNPNDGDAKKIQIFSKKLAMIGTLAQSHTPAMLGGAKTLERWKGFGKDMYTDSVELAKVAEGKKAAAISKAAVKVADTCKRCHDIFR
jgi:Cytochrome C'